MAPGSAETCDAAIDALYDAVEEPASWPAALDALGRSIGQAHGVLQFVDGPHWQRVIPCSSMAADFEAGWHAWSNSVDNPFRLTHRDRPVPFAPLTRDQLVGDAEFLATPFYNEFMRLHECFHGIGVIASMSDEGSVLLTLNRPRDAAPFGSAEMDRLSRLSRHVGRAVLLGGLVARARRSESAARALLEATRLAGAIVDGRARVIQASEGALGLLAASPSVGLRAGRLQWTRAEDGRRFAALLAGPDGGEMAVRRPGQALFVWVVPLGGEPAFVEGGSGSLVLLVDPAAAPGLRPEELVGRLGLTPAEADLACALLVHDKLLQAARALGISHNTAKMHQRAVYAKLGVATRGGLVRLLLRTSLRVPPA